MMTKGSLEAALFVVRQPHRLAFHRLRLTLTATDQFELVSRNCRNFVSGQRTHLQKSGIKGDGVRLFLADAITLIARISMRRRSSYPKPFKAQVVQECLEPGACSFQRRHQPRHQCQCDSQVAADLP